MPAHDNPGGICCIAGGLKHLSKPAEPIQHNINLLLDAPPAQRSNTGMREGLTERIGAGAGFTHCRLDYGLAAAKSPVASSIHVASLFYSTATTPSALRSTGSRCHVVKNRIIL